jgi:hypothetical protein
MQASYIPMKNAGKRQEKPEKSKSKERKPDWSKQRENKRNYD